MIQIRSVKAIVAGCCCVLFACAASADDFKTIDGKEYKNATVSRVEPDGIVITFSGGIVKIPFTELAPEIQKAAADFQQQTYQSDVLRARQVTEAREKRQQELEALSKSQPQPTPVAPAERQSVASSLHGSALDARPSAKSLIYGTVTQVVNEGLLVRVRETNSFGSERIPEGAIVLLIGKFPGFYDHDKIQATGISVGPYEYTTVLGSKSTTRALEAASINKIYDLPPRR